MTDSFYFYWLVLFGAILSRYFLIAGGMHWLFYSVFGKVFVKRGLKPRLWKSIRRDVELSILSALIFALCSAFLLSGYDLGATRLYSDLGQYGWWYPAASFGAVLVLQDTYFYFIHRLFHHPALFRWLHRGHHRSIEPTPWTSFAFDPPEALLQALFLVGIVFALPLHYITLVAVITTMTVWSVINHLGLELFPPSFPGRWLSCWLIGPAHHSIHHRKCKMHYGLYFTVWDKLLGTEDPGYGHHQSESLHSALRGTRRDTSTRLARIGDRDAE